MEKCYTSDKIINQNVSNYKSYLWNYKSNYVSEFEDEILPNNDDLDNQMNAEDHIDLEKLAEIADVSELDMNCDGNFMLEKISCFFGQIIPLLSRHAKTLAANIMYYPSAGLRSQVQVRKAMNQGLVIPVK